MKRKSALHLCLIAGLVLLTAQLSLLGLLLYPYETADKLHINDIQSFFNISSYIQLDAGLPVLAIDSELLQLYINSKSSTKSHCLFCAEKQFISFAILFHGIKDYNHVTDLLLSHFQQAGYKAEVLANINPAELAPDLVVNVPICYLLKKEQTVINFIMFHEREGNFWWHGSVRSDPDAAKKLQLFGLSLHSIPMLNSEGAFDKFNTKLVDFQETQFLIPEDIPHFLRNAALARYRECNHKTAHSFHETYGKDTTHDALRFTHRAWKLLSRAKTLLDKLQVRFWLSSGTCLGYFRQCDIIPYSRDVDLGIFITDYTDQLVPEFISYGFTLKHWFGRVNDSLEISFVSGDIKLDMFFFYEEGPWVWNGGTQAKTGKKFKYMFPRFTLCWTQFLELKVRVPCETQMYIEANYGPNWFTPTSTWDWKTSPNNVKENGFWPESEWPKVIQVHS